MSQICTATKKLQLLQKTREIEEDEEETLIRIKKKKEWSAKASQGENGNNDMIKACLEKITSNQHDIKNVLSILADIKTDLKQLTYQRKMDSVDMSEWFPLNSAEDLEKFMNRNDDDWDSKRKGFYHLLFSAVNDTKGKFSNRLLKTLFTRDFICRNKWPG